MLVSGSLALVVCFAPARVERAAQHFLATRVQRDLTTQFGVDSAVATRMLLDQFLREPLSRVREVAVVRRDALGAKLRSLAAESEADQEPLIAASARSYAFHLEDLRRELLLFSGTNLVLFAAAALMAIWRGAGSRSSSIPAGILAAVTFLAAVIFFVGRDWAWTILAHDYLGWAYIVVVVAVAGLLIDIAANHSRITSVLARAFWWWPV